MLVDMNCNGPTECDDASVGLPATMISHADGSSLQAELSAGRAVSVSFGTVASRGTDFLIDHDGVLQQSWGGSGLGSHTVDGNPGDRAAKLYPRMAFLAWAGRFALYRRALSARLMQRRAMVVNVFEDEPLRPKFGDCYGKVSVATLTWHAPLTRACAMALSL